MISVTYERPFFLVLDVFTLRHGTVLIRLRLDKNSGILHVTVYALDGCVNAVFLYENSQSKLLIQSENAKQAYLANILSQHSRLYDHPLGVSCLPKRPGK